MIPDSASLKTYISKIDDQGTLNCCIGEATCNALEILLLRDDQYRPLSRLFSYYTCRELFGDTATDGGSSIYEAFKAAAEYGICDEATWPFDPQQVLAKPPVEAYAGAEKLKVTRYENLSAATLATWKRFIATGYPIIIQINVSQQFKTLDAVTTYAGSATDPTPIVHNMCVIGYDAGGFMVENSWSQSWGDLGCFYMTNEVAQRDVMGAWVATGLSGVAMHPLWSPPQVNTKVFIGQNERATLVDPCSAMGYGTAGSGVVLTLDSDNVSIAQNVTTVTLPISRAYIGLRGNMSTLEFHYKGVRLAEWSVGSGQSIRFADGSFPVEFVVEGDGFYITCGGARVPADVPT